MKGVTEAVHDGGFKFKFLRSFFDQKLFKEKTPRSDGLRFFFFKPRYFASSSQKEFGGCGLTGRPCLKDNVVKLYLTLKYN
ncbi:hypothetical protein AMECASPLE_007961 [Ameca splendens]|uniref:Uncharacterized protein n=1 Tax=Ameca splendens TaxID=208324 RepID=A0ABV1A655_9TELE